MSACCDPKRDQELVFSALPLQIWRPLKAAAYRVRPAGRAGTAARGLPNPSLPGVWGWIKDIITGESSNRAIQKLLSIMLCT